jgi:hypothetical protein
VWRNVVVKLAKLPESSTKKRQGNPDEQSKSGED